MMKNDMEWGGNNKMKYLYKLLFIQLLFLIILTSSLAHAGESLPEPTEQEIALLNEAESFSRGEPILRLEGKPKSVAGRIARAIQRGHNNSLNYSKPVTEFGGINLGSPSETLEIKAKKLSPPKTIGKGNKIRRIKLTDGPGFTLVRINSEGIIQSIKSNEEVQIPIGLHPKAPIHRIEKVYGSTNRGETELLSDGQTFLYYKENRLGFYLDTTGQESAAISIFYLP